MMYATKRKALHRCWVVNVIIVVLAWPPGGSAQEKQSNVKTYTYKTVDKCVIKADVYGAEGDKPRPVVLWIHGGALIVGHRGQVTSKLRNDLLKAGYVIVSIDYRLAPEAKIPAILDDVKSAYQWVRDEGPRL